MEVTINRLWAKCDYTIGRLLINGRLQCNTLELPERDEAGRLKTGQRGYAIPRGRYVIKERYSPGHKRRTLWVTRPGDTAFNTRYILFHSGNSKVDTKGCVLEGENTKPGWLSNSRAWENRIFETVYPVLKAGELVTLDII